jgi:EAL domain-containing protein (putative c-di-GMP-specific phosphodiesterase class I)/CheY-like chemotaxis protein
MAEVAELAPSEAGRGAEVAPPSSAGLEDVAPLCYLVDRDVGVRRQVSSVLETLGVGVAVFDDLSQMLEARRRAEPDVVLIDITVGGTSGVEMIDVMAGAGMACPVQIMSGLNPVLVEQIRRCGERGGLRMLPVLHKPFQSGAIRHTVTSVGLRRDRQAAVQVDLGEVLAERWLELWYQPTIGLEARKMVGAEAFVRARHPEHGILGPEAFLIDAGERELLDLTRRVLSRTLQDWPAFAAIGTPIELSINVPIVALTKLSIFSIMWEDKPDAANWPGLTLEITEEELVPNLALATKAIAELRPYGVSMSIDNFGPSYWELSRLSELPFKDLKIDRSYISNCDTDRMNAGLCETIVEFAHRFGLTAVAEGIETPGEFKTLRDMGCDVGQGYLFARPQPKNELVSLIRQRSKAR